MPTILSLLFGLIDLLTPSFLRSHSHFPSYATNASRPLAYLQGLRGLAVFLIYASAYVQPLDPLTPTVRTSWSIDTTNYGDDDAAAGGVADAIDEETGYRLVKTEVIHTPVLSLPILRLFHSASAMTCILFVTSGYLLSAHAIRVSQSQAKTQARDSHNHHRQQQQQPRSSAADSDLLRCFSASTFKHALRFFLPALTISFTTFLLVCLHSYGGGPSKQRLFSPQSVFPDFRQPLLPALDSSHPAGDGPTTLGGIQSVLDDWLSFILHDLLNPFDWRPYWSKPVTLYGSHLWVLAYEFRALVVLMGVMAGGTLRMTSRAKGKRRVSVLLVGLMVYAAVWERTEVLLFLAGYLLALWDLGETQGHLDNEGEHGDTDEYYEEGSGMGRGGEEDEERKIGNGLFSPSRRSPPSSPLKPSGNRTFCSSSSAFIRTTTFLLALYLLSYPDKHANYIPGFRTVTRLNLLRKETWQSLGAILLVWSLGPSHTYYSPYHSPFSSSSNKMGSGSGSNTCAHDILLSDMVQYLGQISLALYLVHEPVLQLWGWWLTGWLLDSGAESAAQALSSSAAIPALFVASSTVTGGVIYVADVFWRAVDVPCARLAQDLYLWALQGMEDG